MPEPLIYAKSKKQLVRKLREMYGFTTEQARLIVEACWEGRGYYYNRGDGYFVRFSPEREYARGHVIGRGRYRHTFDPMVEVATKLVTETVEVAETVAREVKKKTKKKATPEKVLKAAFPRAPRIPEEVKEITHYVWDNLPEYVKRGVRRSQTWITVMNIVKMLRDWARDQGFDIQNFDLIHELDWAQGYYEVKAQVIERIMKSVAKEYHGVTEEDVEAMLKYYEEQSKALMEYEAAT